MSTADHVRDLFDGWARRGRGEGMERTHGPAARAAFERLGVEPGARYLDVGCGIGYTVRWAAGIAPDVQALGVDLSSEMIEKARRESVSLPNAQFLCGAFPLADLAASSFDAIFSMEAFYYMADLDGALREVRRLLAPGGRFACVVDYYTENPESHAWPEDLGLTLQLRSEAEWATSFERADLRVIEQARLGAPVGTHEASSRAAAVSLLTLGEACITL